MEQGKKLQFGKTEYERFQFIYRGMYEEIRQNKNLLEKLNEVEEGIVNLDTLREQEGGLTNFLLEDVRSDLVYLKLVIFEQMESIGNK